MTEARYHELLGLLLDGSLTESEALELRRGLEHSPDRLRSTREALMFSDLLGQALTPSREPNTFWHGIESRLEQEWTRTDHDEVAGEPAPSIPPAATKQPARRGWPSPSVALAASLLIVVSLLAIGPWDLLGWRGHRPGQPMGGQVHEVSLRGEAVCAHCILHQTEQCQPAMLVHHKGRQDETYLLDRRNVTDQKLGEKLRCCRSPLPIQATGTVRTANGQLLLGVTRLEVLR